MSFKQLFGLDSMEITDSEILEKINDAQNKNLDKVTFTKPDGSCIEIKLQHSQYFECGIKDGLA